MKEFVKSTLIGVFALLAVYLVGLIFSKMGSVIVIIIMLIALSYALGSIIRAEVKSYND